MIRFKGRHLYIELFIIFLKLFFWGQTFSLNVEYDIRSTVYGDVRGVVNETSYCRAWKGVYFAADTGGDNRWKLPQTRPSWKPDILDATKFGVGCSQIHHNPDVPTNQSEDCLLLNIFVPHYCSEPKSCSDLPVMMFFHGGTFQEGSGEGPYQLYDGCHVAAGGDVVVITANYRLGAYGFLVTEESKGKYNLRGQQGMYDQKAAMEWVQGNIANFGGNPNSVTIFGQSAGSMSVGLHYISPKMFNSGLFNRVIMQSNLPGINLHTLEEAKNLGNDFCNKLNCFNRLKGSCDVTCMRSKNVTLVSQAWRDSTGDIIPIIENNAGKLYDEPLSFSPYVDNDLIPGKIHECLEKGIFNPKIDVLFGSNGGDGHTFIYSLDQPFGYTGYEAGVWAIFKKPPSAAKAILNYYEKEFPKNITKDGRVPFSQVSNDYIFRCSSEVYGREISKSGGNSYAYVFDHIYSNATIFSEFGLPTICSNVTCHCEEILFVFNNTVPSLNSTFTLPEKELADTMVTWWTNFARTGNPNSDKTIKKGYPEWPKFDANSRKTMYIQARNADGTGGSSIIDDGVERCAGLWDSVGYDY